MKISMHSKCLLALRPYSIHQLRTQRSAQVQRNAPCVAGRFVLMQSRRKRVLPAATLERVRETFLKERTWPHLSESEVQERIANSEARRREQDQRMPPAQYDAEKK